MRYGEQHIQRTLSKGVHREFQHCRQGETEENNRLCSPHIIRPFKMTICFSKPFALLPLFPAFHTTFFYIFPLLDNSSFPYNPISKTPSCRSKKYTCVCSNVYTHSTAYSYDYHCPNLTTRPARTRHMSEEQLPRLHASPCPLAISTNEGPSVACEVHFLIRLLGIGVNAVVHARKWRHAWVVRGVEKGNI